MYKTKPQILILFGIILFISLFFRIKIIHELPLGISANEYGLTGFDDEPAHLNYVKFLLENNSFPILENTITVNTEELNNLLRERSSLLESRTQENHEVINLLHQYKNAIDSSLIVSMTDLDGIIKYANENFCKTSGYLKEELTIHNVVLSRKV